LQAIYAFSKGNVWEAYELYMAAELFNPAHELAVLELAPDAVIRQDFELLKSLFAGIAGHSVDGWHVRGKVSRCRHPHYALCFDPISHRLSWTTLTS
jgi:nuclear pore complex protein Nup98-Nup96